MTKRYGSAALPPDERLPKTVQRIRQAPWKHTVFYFDGVPIDMAESMWMYLPTETGSNDEG